MKRLSLRPYHGEIWLCRSLKELRAKYRELSGNPFRYDCDPNGGIYIRMDGETVGDRVWLVYAKTPQALAHEFCHVLLHTFGDIGHKPTEGDGEPFCYLLSILMEEAVSPTRKERKK